MGFFTWTFANKKTERNRFGDYASKCKLPYNGAGYVLCPDNTVIEEQHYDGYGMFDGKDVYELVVEWNRGHLLETLNKNNKPDNILAGVARLLDANMDAMIQSYVDGEIANNGAPGYLKTDWKRDLGIEISFCEIAPPYPIKIISSTKRKYNYADLPRSISCQ